MKLPRGLRNNNPGNIEDGKFAQSLPGYVGSDGRFAVFDNLDAGAHAMQRLLSTYGRKGIDSVEGVINRWAPPTENDSGAYAKTVANYLGVKPGDKIDLNDPDILAKLSSAMAGVENGREVPLAYVDGSAIGSTSRSAANAVNDMAAGRLAGVPANEVQTVSYVPPPFSTQQPAFTPLVSNELQPAQIQPEQPQAVPEPSVGEMGDDADVLKAWGLGEGTPSAPSVAQQPPSEDDALIKAWGLDKSEAAPAAALAQAAEKAPGGRHLSFEEGQELLDREERMAGSSGTFGATATGLLEGVPVAGPALLGVAQRGAAGLSSVINGDSYANNLTRAQDITQAAQAAHPNVTTGANIAGAVGATIPLVAAAPALMGASRTASLGMNMLTGGLSGGAIGGADAAVRSGGDAEAIQSGMKTGLLFGGLAPAAGKAIGAGVNKLAQGVSSLLPSGAASRSLSEALSASGTSADDIANELARNPRLAPMDVDPNLQQMAMNLANQGGAPRSILAQAAQSRAAGARGTVNSAYDAATGTVPDVKAYLDGLKETTRTNASRAFGDALTGAKPVDVTPVLKAIDDEIAPGVQGIVGKPSEIPQGPVEQALARVRAKLAAGDEMLTDAERLHQIQSQLRVEADTLAKGSSGQDKLVASALRKVRGKLIDQIDTATSGKFKPAQQQYADDNAIQDAFDKGLEIFKGGTSKSSLENRPEYWQAWVKDASPAELEAVKVGARVAADQTIGSVRNAAAKGEAIADVDLNVARLEAILGKRETAKLVQVLKDEQKIAQTNAKLFAGSQTAPRQAVNKLTQVTEVTPGISITTPMAGGIGFQVGGIPGAAAGIGLSLARKGVQAGLRARDVARNRLIADALSGDVSGFRDALSKAAAGARVGPRVQGATNRLLSTISPAATQQVNQSSPPRALGQAKRKPLQITVTPKRP
jgi:hypothetical protein